MGQQWKSPEDDVSEVEASLRFVEFPQLTTRHRRTEGHGKKAAYCALSFGYMESGYDLVQQL